MENAGNPRDYRKLFSLEGKVAIVTGGAGHLGSQISKALTDFGARVIAIGRRERIMQENEKLEYYSSDITDKRKFQFLVDSIEVKYGSINILVNNAYMKRKEKFDELKIEQWNAAIANNLTPYFTCSQAVVPYMKKQEGGGSIINIASIYGFLGIDNRIFLDLGNNPAIHYSASKGAIIQMTRHMATLFAKDRIRVNTISPGYFPRKKPGAVERLDYIEEIRKRTPMGRYGEPREIAGATIFLASDASSFVTGHNLVVDGGWSAW